MPADFTNWIPSSPVSEISEQEIHIWRIAMVQPHEIRRHYRNFFAPDEIDRADRFHFDKDRNRFTIARGALRELLGGYLNLPADQIAFVYGTQGKPSLTGPHASSGIHFNLSHSGDVALLAVTLNRELGVDVEQIRADFASEEIAARFFAPEECAKLQTLPAHQQADAFFNCWTRKEAYIKARGLGLSIPLDSFEVAFAPHEEAALLQVKAGDDNFSRWRFYALHPGEGYKAALAAEGGSHQIRLLEWTPPVIG